MLLLFVLTLGIAASATKIQISEPLCQPGDTVVTNLFQGFTVTPVNGGGTFAFCNDTGEDWTTLLIALRTPLTPDQIDCSSSAFESCTKSTNGDVPGVVYAFFSGVTTTPALNFGKTNNKNDDSGDDDGGGDDDHSQFPGVPDGHEFIVDMNCVNGCSGPPDWPKGTVGFGYGNQPNDPGNFPVPPVPEPASLALVVAGIGAVITRTKLQK